MHKYILLCKEGEGTHSEVFKAQHRKSGRLVAIKALKRAAAPGHPDHHLRELHTLRALFPHPNVMQVLETFEDASSGRPLLVFELMDMTLLQLMACQHQHMPEESVKLIMLQIMKALDHMHSKGIMHRDIKPENILLKDGCVKVADFGCAVGVSRRQQPHTSYITTRWYRAPECILGSTRYNTKMDMWSAGCLLYELLCLVPLFPGVDEGDQLHRIHAVVGTPTDALLRRLMGRSHLRGITFAPQAGHGICAMMTRLIPEDCLELLSGLLQYDSDQRLSAQQALNLPYLSEFQSPSVLLQHNSSSGDGDSSCGRSTSILREPSKACTSMADVTVWSSGPATTSHRPQESRRGTGHPANLLSCVPCGIGSVLSSGSLRRGCGTHARPCLMAMSLVADPGFFRSGFDT